MNGTSGAFLRERQPVGARVEIDVRELRLDVLAHLHGALVEEGLSVIEEVDPPERWSRFVDHTREEIEIEHPRLARPRNPGFRRTAGLIAGDVAGRRALDVEAGGQRADLEIALRRGLVALERQFERTVAAELRSAAVEILAQAAGGLSCPDAGDRRRARVAQHTLAVRVGTSAYHAAVAEHHHRAPRPRAREAAGEIVQGHGLLWADGSFCAVGLLELSHVRFEPVVLI